MKVFGSFRNETSYSFEKFLHLIDHTFFKVLHFQYYFTHRNVNSQFKNNLCEKVTFITTEMSVFTLGTDYSCETGYPFDDSRQIGNTS